MSALSSIARWIEALRPVVLFSEPNEVVVAHQKQFRDRYVDSIAQLILEAADPEASDFLGWLTLRLSIACGAVPSGAGDLHAARAKERIPRCVVPAWELGTPYYARAREILRDASQAACGAFVIRVPAAEAAARKAALSSLFLAAMKEGFRGPLFLETVPVAFEGEGELKRIEALFEGALRDEIFSLVGDASTLIVPNTVTLEEQQRPNVDRTVEILRFLRSGDLKGRAAYTPVLGTRGTRNVSVDELRTFMDGVVKGLESGRPSEISKVEVEMGRVSAEARPSLDLRLLEELAKILKEAYKVAGPSVRWSEREALEGSDRLLSSGCVQVAFSSAEPGLDPKKRTLLMKKLGVANSTEKVGEAVDVVSVVPKVAEGLEKLLFE